MKHRTTPALLVVVALLLALNFAAQLPWPTAQAQQPEMAMQPPPRLVGMTTTGCCGDKVLRLWSDGVVESRPFSDSHQAWPRQSEWQEVVPFLP